MLIAPQSNCCWPRNALEKCSHCQRWVMSVFLTWTRELWICVDCVFSHLCPSSSWVITIRKKVPTTVKMLHLLLVDFFSVIFVLTPHQAHARPYFHHFCFASFEGGSNSEQCQKMRRKFFSPIFFGRLNHEYPWSFYHHALNIGFAPDAYNYLTWALLFYFGQWKHAITDFPTLVAEPERMLWSASAETDSIITELASSSYTHR